MKEIPLGNGLNTKVDNEDYEWLSGYSWYAYYDPQRGKTYAAHDTPSGRQVFMHDVIMFSPPVYPADFCLNTRIQL